MKFQLVRASIRPVGGARRKWHRSIGGTILAFSAFVMGAAPVTEARAGGLPIQSLFPTASGDVAERPATPSVFGTVPLPVRAQPTSSRWMRIMRGSLDQPALVRLTMNAGALSRQEQAAFVQSAVNHAVHTGASSHDCSDDGYWAAADETLSRGAGDCIDIAIAKMEALRLLGIPKTDLYLSTGYVGRGTGPGRGVESAALLVRIGDGFWLLTEHSRQIIEAGSVTHDTAAFFPILTYGVGMTWVHGRRVKTASLGN